MDYVVFGTGYGATLMVLGWALRTFGPALRYRDTDPDAPQGADTLVARLSWRRFASALGAVIATSGIVLTFVTFIIIFINPGNSVGSWIAWVCFVLILLAVAVWAWFYVQRYGIYGLLPERREPETVFRTSPPKRDVSQPQPVAASSPVHAAASAQEAFAADEETMVEYDTVDDPWMEGDEYEDEFEARYAKYQSHHPDDTEAFDEVLAAEEAEPSDEPDEVAESPVLTRDAAGEERSDEDEDNGNLPPEGAEDQTESPEPSAPAPVEGVEPPADEADSSDGMDVNPVLSDDMNTVDELSQGLTDTPEGRAEALRRIQAWQPEKGDKDGGR